MKNIRISINTKLYHDISNHFVNYIVKSIDAPEWDYASRSIWSNISNSVVGSVRDSVSISVYDSVSNSGVNLHDGVSNVIKLGS
jgi:hypothetical protein